MGGDCSGQLPRVIEPIRLDASHTTLRAHRTAVEQGAENLIPEEGEHADGLEQFPSQGSGRPVVEPDPGSGLEPVRIRFGQDMSARSKLSSTATVSRDQRTIGRSTSRSRSAIVMNFKSI